MMNVTFLAPNGQEIANVSPEYLAAMVLNAGPEFWENGSGDAALRIADENADGEIIFMVRDSLGVFVQFVEWATGKESVLSSDDVGQSTVCIQQGGEPWELPRAFFVNRDIAITVLQEFVRTGKRSQYALWVEF